MSDPLQFCSSDCVFESIILCIFVGIFVFLSALFISRYTCICVSIAFMCVYLFYVSITCRCTYFYVSIACRFTCFYVSIVRTYVGVLVYMPAFLYVGILLISVSIVCMKVYLFLCQHCLYVGTIVCLKI